ncbi:globin family protein [Flavilitoribacter nigricans]|uniref:Group 1 truncated hemoglobin n=1 Tax=Flavilitoribacter nigricans (strain ATCC 23147 / DSM 23189 / NBRC 102662 / NCIMB 1420 / SS-2) TaxID=1122177 RepID=A0A2D0N9G4_FLAN2|nr:group 1 truncated hemoglobin [Flavilitoribacter nigricans]PHN05127.1 group 1 truncated hemoglobin [Flavilitoribacter nigricans DSM 23189 = NBRC 102662]
MKFRFASVVLLATVLMWTACKNDDDDSMGDDTLYERLGGTEMVSDPANPGQMIEEGRLAIRSVVDSSIFVIAADPDLLGFFAPLLAELSGGNTSNLAALSKNFTDFLSVEAGAQNASYTGMNMSDAHDPSTNPRMAMTADDGDFDNFIAAIVTGANQNNVSANLIAELGVILEDSRSDVVQE